jgi:hypothetical protein
MVFSLSDWFEDFRNLLFLYPLMRVSDSSEPGGGEELQGKSSTWAVYQVDEGRLADSPSPLRDLTTPHNLEEKNAASYQTCGRRRTASFSGIRKDSSTAATSGEKSKNAAAFFSHLTSRCVRFDAPESVS